jgi:hypothetical protein
MEVQMTVKYTLQSNMKDLNKDRITPSFFFFTPEYQKHVQEAAQF